MGGRICFLVGSAALSGGTYVIFQHASHLHKNGYHVTLAVQEPFNESTLAWHDKGSSLRCLRFEEARQEAYDVVIATWWKTSLEISGFDAPRYAYFVQSIESFFYPEREGPLRALVEATYSLPVNYVTEASWIVRHLAIAQGRYAALVRNGIRKDIYTLGGESLEPRVPGKPRVLVEGHFNVPFKNTALALKLARAAGVSDIWVMTGSPVQSLPGAARVFSRASIRKTPEIYRSCDILVKLSTVEGMFGPPLEMFHCGGTAIVFDVSGHDEYIRSGENAIVVPGRDTQRVIRELKDLLSNPDRLGSLKAAAIETALQWPDWDESSAQFRTWVDSVFEQPETDRQAVQDAIRKAWQDYEREEKRRLKTHPMIVWGYKLRRLEQRLPVRMRDWVKRIRTLIEVIDPSRSVS